MPCGVELRLSEHHGATHLQLVATEPRHKRQTKVRLLCGRPASMALQMHSLCSSVLYKSTRHLVSEEGLIRAPFVGARAPITSEPRTVEVVRVRRIQLKAGLIPGTSIRRIIARFHAWSALCKPQALKGTCDLLRCGLSACSICCFVCSSHCRRHPYAAVAGLSPVQRAHPLCHR